MLINTNGKPKGVLMVLESAYPCPVGGGAEGQVRTLSTSLVTRGVKVIVVTPLLYFGPQARTEFIDGAEVVRLRYPRMPMIGGLMMLGQLAWFLVRRRHDYSVVHAHIANNMAALSCLIAPLLGKPVIVKLTGLTEIAGGILAPRAGVGTQLKKLAVRRARYYQATSSHIGRMLAAAGFRPQKIRQIPNAVDTRSSERPGRDLSLRAELCAGASRVGVFVGRLAPEKGLDVLLNAWAEAFRSRDDVRLLVVGAGVSMESLQTLAQTLGIGQQVLFVGHTPTPARYLAVADFALLPSLQEGLSNALLEAMSAGLPTIGSRISGNEDFIVPGKTGWLFTAGSVPELRACLSAAAQMDLGQIDQMGVAAKRFVNDHASIAAVVGRLLDLYGLGESSGPTTRHQAG
ncbi:MAG TPA: glycosyltransferase family 4 protein [Burkholderiaceae bacterium]|nr:glycosyltransferase family 4 protein [Burkholderiaceae bacterium]